MRKLLSISILLVLFGQQLVAQQSFNENPAGFLEEMTEYLNTNFKKEKVLKAQAEQLMLVYQEEWNSAFGIDDQIRVIKTCNKMLKRKMRAETHFMVYLPVVLEFARSPQSEQSFINWDDALDYIISKKPNKYVEFLNMTNLLLTENVIYQSSHTKWVSGTDDFYFEIEDKKPVVHFGSMDMKCYSKNDSSTIYGTRGKHYPLDNKWYGEGGKVTWERVELAPDEVYAEFEEYKINTKFSKFTVDTVRFYNTKFFTEPLLGKLKDNIQYFNGPERASYPRFSSFQKRYVIKDFYPGVDYDGGFSMNGLKMIGSGSVDEPAILRFKYEGEHVVNVFAPRYTLRTNGVLASQDARVVIYIKDDSLFHPGAGMEYKAETKKLEIYRVEHGLGLSPFFNSFHDLEMYTDELHWDMNEGKIKFFTFNLSGESRSIFESNNFYSKVRFDEIQGMAFGHPLSHIRNYYRKVGRKDIGLEEYSRYIKLDETQTLMQLLRLSHRGFIEYNVDKKEFLILDKLNNYLMAFGGLIDYDVIQFESIVYGGRENAMLDLVHYDLELYGIDMIQLSDSQMVRIEPDHGRITMKENRDFAFNGLVRAGMLKFYASDAYFDYNSFKLDMPDIDSLTFKVKSFDMYALDSRGNRKLVDLKSYLQDIGGVLYIDKSNNKSGRKRYTEYPIFKCSSSGKVYYEYHDGYPIHNLTYNSDIFYYQVDPFEIDSLDNFTTEGFELNGTLVSGGIFPDLHMPLKVMDDYSLGLVHNTGEGGMPAYGGSSRFYNTITLSNQGFYGNGRFEYLTSNSYSEAFLFTPDSVTADLSRYTVDPQSSGVEFPQLQAWDVDMKYYPGEERMLIIHKDKYHKLKDRPIAMYDRAVELHGNYELTPGGSTGIGTLVIQDAELDSKEFMFGHHTIDAASSDFRLKATYTDMELIGSTEEYELITYDYKAHIDMNKEVGRFTSNTGESNVQFVINQYMATIDKFDWYMHNEKLKLENTKYTDPELYASMSIEELCDADLIGARFTSINPYQDSLNFIAKEAMYDRRQNIIDAKGVKIIKVADAAVFPSDGKVRIFKKAEMDTLRNAQLLTNVQTKHHRFYNVVASIKGRNKFEANGNYDYVDVTNAKQKIFFNRIYADASAHTQGSGKIPKEQEFTLSPYFDYTGDVFLKSSNTFLKFDGGTRIKHICDTLEREWLKFVADIDPQNVMIPVSTKPVNIDYRDLALGVMVSRDTSDVYSAFLRTKSRVADKEIIYADGFIVYDEPSAEYRVSNLSKLKNPDEPGNYLTFNTATCITHGEGKFAFGEDLGLVNMEAFGELDHFIAMDSTNFEMVLAIDFFFAEDALKEMSRDLQGTGGLGVSPESNAYVYAMNYWLGPDKANDVISDINLYGSMRKVPDELKKTLIITDVNFYYDEESRSFISDGQIGIGMINGKEVNIYVDGIIEISRDRSGDKFTIYLELSDEEYYLFEYSRGRMMAISHNQDFNNVIRETDPDKRKLFDEKTREMYLYTLSTPRKRKQILKKFDHIFGDGEDD